MDIYLGRWNFLVPEKCKKNKMFLFVNSFFFFFLEERKKIILYFFNRVFVEISSLQLLSVNMICLTREEGEVIKFKTKKWKIYKLSSIFRNIFNIFLWTCKKKKKKKSMSVSLFGISSKCVFTCESMSL